MERAIVLEVEINWLIRPRELQTGFIAKESKRVT
jgi:hypothetical protein